MDLIMGSLTAQRTRLMVYIRYMRVGDTSGTRSIPRNYGIIANDLDWGPAR